MTQKEYADAYIRGFELTQRFLVSRGVGDDTAELSAETPVPPQACPQAIDVQRALAKCAPADRDMIEKTYVAGYTSAELGRQRGCTTVAVRVRLLRARRRIRETIA